MSIFCSLHHSSSRPCVSLYNMCFLQWEAAGPPSQIPMSKNTFSAVCDYLSKIFTSNQYLCPQTSGFPHFSLHAMCIRPCMHSPHVPWHRWLQLSMAPHGIWHRDSSSSENGSKTRTDHKQAHKLCCQVNNPVCWKHKWCKMWGSQHSVTKKSTVPECDAVSLGKQLSEASQCFYSGSGISSWPV